MTRKRKAKNRGSRPDAARQPRPASKETLASLPPNSVFLSDLPFEAPKVGMVVWAAIYSLGGAPDVLPQFSLPDYHFGVGSNTDGQKGLWYKIGMAIFRQATHRIGRSSG